MQKQIFQTNSATRWKSFVWFLRILMVFFLVIMASVVISLWNKKSYDLKVLTYNEKKLPNINTDKSKKIISKSEQIDFAKQLAIFRKKHRKFCYQRNGQPLASSINKKYLPVKAAFYVNWDLNSNVSLRENIGHLNMVLPEWGFIANSKGKIDLTTEAETLVYLHKNKVSVVPMLSNFRQWNTDSTYILLKNPVTRKYLVDQIKTVLDTNDFRGINIDFENLPPKTQPYLVQFSKELYETLHPDGYLTTIDINPSTPASTFKNLAPYYDFMFLMAYNEHFPNGEPGCISSLGFVESAMDVAMREVPSNKIILSVAGYGFDWKAGQPAEKISYPRLISLANEYEAKVEYDFGNSDIAIYYSDDDGIEHEAHCNDAAGTFNTLRTAYDYGAAGVALWYLGSEDSRIWNFYSKNLNENYLKNHPYNTKSLENITSVSSVNNDGVGEIMQMVNEPCFGKTKFEFNSTDQLITSEKYTSLPSSYLIKRYGSSKKKRIALTFDDGPDPKFTPKILDILKEKHVTGTFFVTGINIDNNIPLVKRIYDEGNEIGNHTFTHPNLEITSENRERIELRSTRLLIESILGHSTLLFRPPYNTDSEPRNLQQIKPLAVANDEGFIAVTSFIDPNDWEEDVCADTIVARAIAQQHAGNVMLLHDAGGDRTETIKALPQIIDYYLKHGYQFVSVSALMNKSRDQVMPPVKNEFGFTETLDYIFFFITFLWDHFIHGFFVVAILLIIFRLISMAILSILQHAKDKKYKLSLLQHQPKVSIIVPAFNEELNAVKTIENLLHSDYSDFNIVFVDDGSKDQTLKNVTHAFENNAKVKILTKTNGGKAAALNCGIEQADGEILVCIDADTVLPSDAVSRMISYFTTDKVGAVAGNVKVGNTLNLLTNWQSIEYTTSQNFDRRAYDYVNAILVVPGAIGAFRKEALEAVGGFTTDTLAEDCDLTLRILRAGYKIHSCNEAIALTEAPETLSMFMKQRSRWTFGMMQSFWKHRDLLFNVRKPNLGWIALPNLLIFNFIIPLFSPIVDILFIFGLFTHNASEYLTFYLTYYVVDCLIAWLAYHYDKQKFTFKTVIYLFIQRFIYRQLLFFVLFKSYNKAIKGELVSWGILKRTGNVKTNKRE